MWSGSPHFGQESSGSVSGQGGCLQLLRSGQLQVPLQDFHLPGCFVQLIQQEVNGSLMRRIRELNVHR